MTYRKLIKGRLTLVPLAESLPLGEFEERAAAILEAAVRSKSRIPASQLWDVAAELHRRHPAAAEASGNDPEADTATDSAVCTAPITQVILYTGSIKQESLSGSQS